MKNAAAYFLRDLKLTSGIDNRLDVIYAFVNDTGFAGKYTEIDDVLTLIKNRDFSLDTDSLLGFLTITRRFSSKLKTRPDFVDFCEEEFNLRREPTEELMKNLK